MRKKSENELTFIGTAATFIASGLVVGGYLAEHNDVAKEAVRMATELNDEIRKLVTGDSGSEDAPVSTWRSVTEKPHERENIITYEVEPDYGVEYYNTGQYMEKVGFNEYVLAWMPIPKVDERFKIKHDI